MIISNKAYSVAMLALSVLGILYMLFMLIIVPILPLDDDNILCSFSQTPFLLLSGICGLLFCGSLSIFTIFVMGKNRWKQYGNITKNKMKL